MAAPTITQEQIVSSARAGLAFLILETTLVPGNRRQQLAVLEAVLGGIASEQLLVVDKPAAPVVESVPKPDTDKGTK